MKSRNLKKLLILNIPYVLFALLGTKLSEAVRLAPGADFSAKALHIADGFSAAFSSLLPSFHPIDLCVGIAIAAVLRLAVYVKANTQEIRKNMEYGTARWGSADESKPYVDLTFRTTSSSRGRKASL
jgi:type IV secretion system protein VirD4